MSSEMDDELVEEPFESDDELYFSRKIEDLKQASRQRKYQIRREIEEAAEKRRFRELYDDPDE